MAIQEQESIELQGELSGHTDWVTSIIAAPVDQDILLSGSRDKSIVVWKLQRKPNPAHNQDLNLPTCVVEGRMQRRLLGHNSFIQDLDVTTDCQYCISSSWDKNLRLWNLKTGKSQRRFKGHGKDVLSCAFSADNHLIVSGSRDKTIRIWNTIGDLKTTIGEGNPNAHRDWVTCVRFSPNAEEPLIVSASRDRLVKVWNMDAEFTLKHNLKGHKSYVNAVTVSPDGSLCASGGKLGKAMLWDLNEGKNLSCLEAGGEIHALTFSPNRYWLCGAVGESIKIWDLETKEEVGTLPSKTAEEKRFDKAQKKKGLPILCTCLSWSHDGKTLFAGYTDNKIRVWSLISPSD